MRRRKPAGGDDANLNQPLLSGDSEDAHVSRDQDASHPFNLLGALQEFFLRLFATLGLCAKTPPPLTEAQKLRLARLTRRVDVPYDATNVEHVEQLRELWNVTFPDRRDVVLGVSTPHAASGSETHVWEKAAETGTSLRHEGWKDMGWQGVDPATDFRSGGVLSLQNLLWFAKNEKETYDRLLHKRTGKRSEWEYPFAAAGVNVTFALVDLLELRDSSSKKIVHGAGVVTNARAGNAGNESREAHLAKTHVPTSSAASAFLAMLDPGRGAYADEADEETRSFVSRINTSADPDAAFENLYVTFWEVFDNEWLDRRASYMEFSQVMESCMERVRWALERAGRHPNGCTIEGVRETLGLG
jgi:hypothetical protein